MFSLQIRVYRKILLMILLHIVKHPYILLIRVHYFSQEGRESVFPKLGEVNSVKYEYKYISLYMKLIIHSDSVKLENKIDCFLYDSLTITLQKSTYVIENVQYLYSSHSKCILRSLLILMVPTTPRIK